MTTLEAAIQNRAGLSESDLEKAVARAREMGFGLDTAALELGRATEAQLEHALADHYRLPTVAHADLREIPTSTRDLLTAEQASRYLAVPFGAGPGRIDLAVAMAPDVAKLDELAFILGRRVRLFVVTEPRLHKVLADVYAHSLPTRLVNLAGRLDRSEIDPSPPPEGPRPSEHSISDTFVVTAAVESPKPFKRQVRPPQPRDEHRSITLTDEEREAIFGSRPPTVAQPHEPQEPRPYVPGELAELDRKLRGAGSPTAVGEAFLEAFHPSFDGSLVLRPEGELLRGWLGVDAEGVLLREVMAGPGLSREWLQAVENADTAFVVLGPSVEASGLANLIQAKVGDTATLVALRVSERLVGLAVGSGRPDPAEMERIRHASLLTGLALERWILNHKQPRSTAK